MLLAEMRMLLKRLPLLLYLNKFCCMNNKFVRLGLLRNFMKTAFLISSLHSAAVPFQCGLGRVVSRFFSVNLKV